MSITARKLYQFPISTFIENIAIRPNGHLLLTTFREASLFDLDPEIPDSEPRLVVRLRDVTDLTGIAEIAPDVFAVAGGVKAKPFRFVEGTMKVFRVDLTLGVQNAKVELIAGVADAQLLNGMTNVSENKHILLALDSITGSIMRINTQTGVTENILTSSQLGIIEESGAPVGANGAKYRDGYLYFTNSNLRRFSRIKTNTQGDVVGDIEVLMKNDSSQFQSWHEFTYDDFDFDSKGNAFVTAHPNYIAIITPDRKQIMLEGGSGSVTFEEPTSLRVSKDGCKLYVACAGKFEDFCGSVVEVDLTDLEAMVGGDDKA